MSIATRAGAPVVLALGVGLFTSALSFALWKYTTGWYREAVLVLTFLPPLNGAFLGWRALLYARDRLPLHQGVEKVAGDFMTALLGSTVVALVIAPITIHALFGRSALLWTCPAFGWLVFRTLLHAAEDHALYGPLGRWIRGRRPLETAKERVGERPVLSPDTAISWGGKPIRDKPEMGNYLVVGAPGSGKSVTLNLLLRSILARVKRRHDRVLIYDGKTEMVSALMALGVSRNSLSLLHPFDARGVAWRIGKDITTPEEVQEMALTLFPPDKTNQPFFEKAAVDILQGVIISFMTKKGNTWTLRDLVLSFETPSRLKRILKWSPRNAGRMQYFRLRRTMNDVLTTARSKVQRYEVVAANAWYAEQAGRTFSLSDWMLSGGVAVLGNSHQANAAVNALNRALFRRAGQYLLDKQVKPAYTWLVLDELSKAGKFDGLDLLMTKGRSKGISTVIGFQDISGLQYEESYGPYLSEEITGMIANKAVFRLEAPKTAKWAEEFFGSEDSIETRHSIGKQGKGETQDRQQRPVVTASQLLALPKLSGEGLPGYFTGADTSTVWQAWIPMGVIRQNPLPDPAVDFEPTPKEHGVLPPWSEEELRSLGLSDAEVEEDVEMVEEEGTSPDPELPEDPFGGEGDGLAYMSDSAEPPSEPEEQPPNHLPTAGLFDEDQDLGISEADLHSLLEKIRAEEKAASTGEDSPG